MPDAVRVSPRVRLRHAWHDVVDVFRDLAQRSPARFARTSGRTVEGAQGTDGDARGGGQTRTRAG